MARPGENDPRWIIEDREDGKNVNNWHWMERNMHPWASEKLEKLLKTVKYSDSTHNWSVKSSNIDGVGMICVRKGKLKKIFNLDIEIEFISKIKEVEIEGEIKIEDFSYDTPLDEIEFNVVIKTHKNIAKDVELVSFVKNTFGSVIEPIFAEFIADLNKYCDSIKLPKKKESALNDAVDVSVKHEPKIGVLVKKEVNEWKGVANANIVIEEDFSCGVEFLFDVFTDASKIEAYTRARVKFSLTVGFEYAFLNGTIRGEVIEIEKMEKVVLTWRFNDWPIDSISIVTFLFSAQGGGSKLKIVHNDVVQYDEERVQTGWMNIFIRPAKRVFNIGSGDIDRELF